MSTPSTPKDPHAQSASLEKIRIEDTPGRGSSATIGAGAEMSPAVHAALEAITPIDAKSIRAGIFAVLVATATFLAGWYLPTGMNIAGILLCLVVFLGALGKAVSGRVLGALINERNLVSLARFQMVLWTMAVLSSYFGYAIARMQKNIADPLAVAIDWHLWVLMGMSTTSLVASPLILGTKKDKEPDPMVTAMAARETREDKSVIDATREGTLYANTSIQDARFTDLFQGDEIGNTARVDLTKVQMFYFTLVAVLAFLVLSVHNLASASPDYSQLPKLADGLVAVLGISHVGYLTGKSVDHTARK